MQLILLFHEAFQDANLPLRLRPYSVMVTSAKSGLIETVPDAKSIDGVHAHASTHVCTLTHTHTHIHTHAHTHTNIHTQCCRLSMLTIPHTTGCS
jgi:hypothetical protein